MSVALDLHVLELPMSAPFTTGSASIGTRSTVLVELVDRPGSWGEAAPFQGQDETIDELLSEAEAGVASPTLRAAIDEAYAVGDGLIQAGSSVPVTCLAIGLHDPIVSVDRAVEVGVGAFKLKVAPDAMDHVEHIRRRHPDVELGVDGNRSFTRADTDFMPWRDLRLAFAEELFVTWDVARQSSFRSLGVPLFTDESIRSPLDAERLLEDEAVDGVTLKPGRLGWSGALAAREQAEAHGKRWRASGLLETSVGRSYTNALAAMPGAFLSDVAPANWFMADIAEPGETPMPPVVPDMDKVGRFRVSRRRVAVDVS